MVSTDLLARISGDVKVQGKLRLSVQLPFSTVQVVQPCPAGVTALHLNTGDASAASSCLQAKQISLSHGPDATHYGIRTVQAQKVMLKQANPSANLQLGNAIVPTAANCSCTNGIQFATYGRIAMST